MRPTFRPRPEALEDRTAPATLWVTTTDDAGAGSLRQAILDANANAGADAIHFNIPGGGVRTITITPGVRLPFVGSETDIDGRTQPGYAGVPLVQVTGAGQVDMGLGLSGDNNSVRGLILNRCTHNSLAIGGAGNVVQANYIGTDPTGTMPAGTDQSFGVVIDGGNGNLIGTDGDGIDDAAERNVISGNANTGVNISGDSNVVAGNYVGTNPAGTAAVPSGAGAQGFGVWISAGTGNVIGTNGSNDEYDANERNVISGNSLNGVRIAAGVANTWVAGNYIGLNAAGTAALPNLHGVFTFDVSTRVGTNADGIADEEERNVISGNTGYGVISHGEAWVAGNYIGTDPTGAQANGNTVGVAVGGLIGTNGDGVYDEAERNVISGNGSHGVELRTNCALAGNYIGLDATGANRLGNGAFGVVAATGNRIGTDGSNDAFNENERNVIAGNGWGGIALGYSGASTNNRIAGNYVGLDAAGMTSVRNNPGFPTGEFGIVLLAGWSGNNVIGTNADGVADADERNVIADGVSISNWAGTVGNVIAGNYVGYRQDSTVGGTGGVSIAGPGNRVGTNGDGVNDAAEANVIAGLYLSGAATTGNVVAGNFIGTDPTGTVSRDIVWNGVQLLGVSGNRVEGNVIGGYKSGGADAGYGIFVNGGADNRIAGNFIGTNPAGADLGNERDGILLSWFAQGNEVVGNTIAHNGRAGIAVGHLAGNRLLGNAVFNNGGLGIDLLQGGTGYGASLNDSFDADLGANNFQNFPVLVAAPWAGGVAATGTLSSLPFSKFRVEYFANAAPGDLSAGGRYGEGARYLGFVEVVTDMGGVAALSPTAVALAVGEKYLTATATRLELVGGVWVPTDTSEFSPSLDVFTPRAVPGGPYSFAEGASLTLNGSGSFDPDGGGPLTYSWDVNGDGTFGDAVGANPTLTWPELIALGLSDGPRAVTNAQLRVGDGTHNGTSKFTVNVVNTAPHFTDIAGDAAGVRGQRFTFTFTAADVSPADQADRFQFHVDWNGDGTTDEVLFRTSGSTHTRSFPDAGTFTVKVKSFDDGHFGPEDQLPVTVNAAMLQTEGGKQSLFVGGTTADDKISLVPGKGTNAGKVEVKIDGTSYGFFAADGRVVVYGQDGHDDVSVAQDLLLPAWLYGEYEHDPFLGFGDDTLRGGGGHDVLAGGSGDDTLDGRAGNDILLGGRDDDLLDGGNDRDVLVGGSGGDALDGGNDEDLLVSGGTAYDFDPAALGLVLGEWARTDRTAAERRAALMAGVGPGGTVRIAATTAFTDTTNVVTGGGSKGAADWFVVNMTIDGVTDLGDADLVNFS